MSAHMNHEYAATFRANCDAAVYADGKLVAVLHGSEDEQRQHALLFAAASELYEACMSLLGGEEAHGQICETDPCARCQAKTAIAKARGKLGCRGAK